MSQDTLDSDDLSGPLKVKPSQARTCIIKALKAGKVPMLHGSPAIGKSEIIKSIAEQFNLLLIDERLSQCDPTDLKGFPHVVEVAGQKRATFIPMDTFPIEGTPLPLWPDENGNQVMVEVVDAEGKKSKVPRRYNGWLLFLDELTSAKDDVQAPAYKLILDKMVGQYKLHPKVAIVAAGNLESDNAIVVPMSTALKSRMTHLVLQLDVKEWLSWAIDNKFDHRITDYINWKPNNLYTFDPDSSDMSYAAPRTWHFNQQVLSLACNGNVKDPDFKALSAGHVGHGVTLEFLTFCDIYGSLPKIPDIMMASTTVPMPGEPSILFALSGSLGSQADKSNLDKLIPFIMRMPLEFQVVTLRYIIKRDKTMMANPAISQWVQINGKELF